MKELKTTHSVGTYGYNKWLVLREKLGDAALKYMLERDMEREPSIDISLDEEELKMLQEAADEQVRRRTVIEMEISTPTPPPMVSKANEDFNKDYIQQRSSEDLENTLEDDEYVKNRGERR